ncbi:MAG: RNA polymerase sigma factor [Planctomycetota bacterium]|nr:MAG: RNA polymerase sigma factor [Planctomycetota bacterium]
MQDSVLVARILGGELSLFGQVVRRHDRKLRQLIRWSVRDPDAQEELVQQTFYLAFRNLERLSDPEKLESWLLRIARNCAADHHRSHGARKEEPLPADLEAAPPPALPAPLASGDVWESAGRLAGEHRTVLELRYRRGLSYSEIARRLGVPVSTVRGRVHLARQALRQRLAQDREEE